MSDTAAVEIPIHPGPVITAPEIRPLPFSDPSLRSAIERTLSQLKDGETWAFVAVGEGQADNFTAHMTINVRIPGHDKWSFGGYVDLSNHDPVKYGVELRLAG